MRFYSKNLTEEKKQENVLNEIPLNETFFNSKNKFIEKEFDIIPIAEQANHNHSHSHLEEVFIFSLFFFKEKY